MTKMSVVGKAFLGPRCKTRALQRKSAQERSSERDADRFSRAMAVQLHGTVWQRLYFIVAII